MGRSPRMTLRLPKLLDDGCVLQAGVIIHVWGTGDPGCIVLTRLAGEQRMVQVKDDGTWNVPHGPIEAGGPYELAISYEDGTEHITRQCYAGEVFLCSGQSNMELPMAWVRADYPQEWDREPDPLLRQYKVVPDCDFNGPRDDHDHAFWQGCDTDTLGDFSALAYFFGRRVRQWLGVPVGLLNISLGGSPIESWMDVDTLRAFPEALANLELYLGDGVALRRSCDSVAERDRWYQALGYEAVGDAHHEWLPLIPWHCPESKNSEPQDAVWRDIRLPGWYEDCGLAGFRGEITVKKTVFLPSSDAGKPALLRLGTMNDADHTWVNGVLVGGRSNVYEPRDYSVEAGVLRAGANEIRVRLVIERPGGRVTPGKRMTLVVGDDIFDLSGNWRYAVTAEADRDCPFEDFVRWKPTGLYNAMLAPCFPYAMRAVLWYQGESNTGDQAMRYGDELKAMIELWRGKWHQPDMPFLIVQLPKFDIDAIEDGGWPLIREQEWRVADQLENVAAVVTLDAGESNDLHPHNKKTIADRVFNVAMGLVYGQQAQPQPVIETAEADDRLLRMHCVWRNSTGEQIQSQNRHLMTLDGDVPREIDFLWRDCATSVRAEVWLDGCDIVARMPARMPDEVRYAWSNSPEFGLICDDDGVLLPPFRLPLFVGRTMGGYCVSRCCPAFHVSRPNGGI